MSKINSGGLNQVAKKFLPDGKNQFLPPPLNLFILPGLDQWWQQQPQAHRGLNLWKSSNVQSELL